MEQPQRIAMPAQVFVDAVRMANSPCSGQQEPLAAVQHLTKWWNEASTTELRCAYGFALYSRFGGGWISGNPEEGWIDSGTWDKHARPAAEASLLDGDMTFVFFKRAVDEGHGFHAEAVDGSHGFSGGLGSSDSSGNEILTRSALEALSLVPIRFPEAWRRACHEAQSGVNVF
ncbi:hypothetical protein ACYPKM_04905 [Pseudomonas aeruginosa]